MIGKTIGRYRVVAELGRGGMGEVWVAEDPSLKRKVALKMLQSNLADHAVHRSQFRREAETLAALNHPNIVTIHSVEEYDGRHFFTMELVDGQPLSNRIPEDGLPLETFFEIAVPLADAIAAAHGRGVLHRDLKPSNVMLTTGGHVKVLDFGLAKRVTPESDSGSSPAGSDTETIPNQTSIAGTLAYMSPEQVQGRVLDARSDIFSLGTLLYEMITGQRPYRGDSTAQVISAILRDAPPDAGEVRGDVPFLLTRLIRRCQQKDPEHRLQTVKDVRNELEEIRREWSGGELFGADTAGAVAGGPGIGEDTFRLGAELCRKLDRANLDPSMIGGRLHYLDNRVSSDVLLCCLHGMGLDQRSFEPLLRAVPFRAVAPTLYGFEPENDRRPRLSTEDHLTIIGEFVKQLDARLHPRQLVLVGFSSGADLVMQLAASRATDVRLDALLALDPNLGMATCFVTGRLARISSGDTADVLPELRSFGLESETLEEWLHVHHYLVEIFAKFRGDLAVLKRCAEDALRPVREAEAQGSRAFVDWYRAATTRLKKVRCVFSDMQVYRTELAQLKLEHLDRGVLGDRFEEDSLTTEPAAAHFDLIAPERLGPHIERIVDELNEPE